MSVDYYFILDVFNTYKRGEDFRNQCYHQKEVKMNNFCRNLGDSLRDECEIEVDILVSNNKKRNFFTCLNENC